MRCESCRGVMRKDQCSDVLDGGVPFRMNAWSCAACGDVVEEIKVFPKNGEKMSRRFRYVVRPWAIYGGDERLELKSRRRQEVYA
ncbi:MAG: hypothetical protein ACREI2_12860 [Nitrospiraceae bacterium]